jgi:hydroxymethylpyrimidine pyrophosphatase-like HAD family hydrolase
VVIEGCLNFSYILFEESNGLELVRHNVGDRSSASNLLEELFDQWKLELHDLNASNINYEKRNNPLETYKLVLSFTQAMVVDHDALRKQSLVISLIALYAAIKLKYRLDSP